MVWVVLCGIGIVTLGFILIFSFGSIGVGEYGLDYSGLFKSIDTKTYGSGYYYIGISHSFLKFPGIVQNIEFSRESKAHMGPVRSRTLDGLEVQLEISFQYRLMYEKVYGMYMKYGEHYERAFILTAVDILTDMTTKFTAYKFFYDRQSIGDTMKKELAKIYAINCFAIVDALQLRTVDLPTQFEGSIQETEVKKQDIEKAKAERIKITVECETRVKEAEFQKNVSLNRAYGEAQITEQNNIAEVQNTINTQTQQAEAYVTLKSQLGLNNKQLLNYIKAKMIKDYEHPNNIIISMNKLNE